MDKICDPTVRTGRTCFDGQAIKPAVLAMMAAPLGWLQNRSSTSFSARTVITVRPFRH
jgi:hypothetical protein